jgi:hypothetical protein
MSIRTGIQLESEDSEFNALSPIAQFGKSLLKRKVGSDWDCPPVLRVLSRRSGRTPALPYPPPKPGHYNMEETGAGEI